MIDADLVSHEVSACGQYVDPDSGELIVRPFEFVSDLADQRIKEIEAEVWSTEPSTLYFTGDKRLNKLKNKELKREGKPPEEYKDNFRFAVAKKVEYKGNRKNAKPIHFHNLRAYLMSAYDYIVAEGYEADDLMSIHQWERVKVGDLSTIICSRDKDLRITPGMHFGWSVGKQPQFGPRRVTELGELELKNDGKKLVGTGLKFFYSQIIMGDATDSIPGLPRGGPALAYKSLSECEDEAQLFERVAGLYENKFGESWREEMLEQAQLLWMVRELTEEGEPVMWTMYDERGEK